MELVCWFGAVVALDERRETTKRIIDLGVRTFTPGEDPDRRKFYNFEEKRGASEEYYQEEVMAWIELDNYLMSIICIDIDAST